MGTLGCINDMLRRDKENRELRRLGRERMNDTRNRLIDLNKKDRPSTISLEQLEEIKRRTNERKESDSNRLFKTKLIMLGILLITALLAWIVFTFFL